MSDEPRRCLLVTAAGEVHTKSPSVRRRFRRQLVTNARDAVSGLPRVHVRGDDRRIRVTGPALDEAAERVARVFGVQRVATVLAFPEGDLDGMLARAADLARHRVRGRTFAARVHRRGDQPWRRSEAERALGSALVEDAAGVHLDDPDVVVRVDAYGDWAYLEESSLQGPGGLPVGTQREALALLSGGFDSPVAAWSVQRRGVPLDFLHARLGCAASDHAAVVAHQLWGRWGAGTRPRLWIADFEPVREALLAHPQPSLRQVLLKRTLLAAADRVAERIGAGALVTGDSLGQVSSQTLAHMASTDGVASRPILRPLVAMDKQDIIAESRRLGLHDLSVRAREVCDLSSGRVAVAAHTDEVNRAAALLPDDLVDGVLADLRVLPVAEWTPGAPPLPAPPTPPSTPSEHVTMLSSSGQL